MMRERLVRSAGTVTSHVVYPTIGTSWFILDLITGTFFVDAYAGNWNFFDDIDASFSE